MKRFSVSILTIALLMSPAIAQDEAAAPTDAPDGPSLADRLLQAIQLPSAAVEAREAGVPQEAVADVLEKARVDGVSAADARAVLVEGTQQVKDGGDPKNFGAVVQERLAQGLRGRDLADAIHAAKGKAHGQAKKQLKEAHVKGEAAVGEAKKKAHDHGHDAAKKVKASKEEVEKVTKDPGNGNS